MRDPNLHHQSMDGLDVDTIRSNDLSAFMDGELSHDRWTHLAQALRNTDRSAQPNTSNSNQHSLSATWHRYHLIGEVIRSGHVVDSDFDTQASIHFAQGVMARLAQQSKSTPANNTEAHPPKGAGLPPSAAANDELFRWRGLAIAASIAVVGLVSWNHLALMTPASSTLQPLHRTHQLANTQEAQPPLTQNMVAVETTQGIVIRDTRLEGWMQTHRQHGGGSALQAPAGFLRAATLDAPKP